MNVHRLTFNDFAENTYILSDDTGECVIVDPGCSNDAERHQLDTFIANNHLSPSILINTHGHIDHIYGLNYVHEKYGLDLHIHQGEKVVIDMAPQIGQMYGIPFDKVDIPMHHIDENSTVKFGATLLEIFFTPGHSPASVCFFHRESGQLIVGDVLFQGSIGRTDLPGGDYDTLIGSIVDNLFSLSDEVLVYPGHGPETTIGVERASNPFLHGLVG
jgi:hydroxyacylglutathione hydrolase